MSNSQSLSDSIISVTRVDFSNAAQAAALVAMLDAYAHDPMGGGEGLTEFAKARLVPELAARPGAFSVLAYDAEKPVGLVNCLEGFSTFACRALINVHDVAVLPDYRGRGIAEKMLQLCESIAREKGACKMTLEVLEGNVGAIRAYSRFGFAGYQLGSAAGQAQLMQKWLK